MNLFLAVFLGLILSSTFLTSNAKSRQKRWWMWYNGYADTILGFIFTVPFQTFLPGLGPVARSLVDVEETNIYDFEIQPQYQEEIERTLAFFHYLGITSLDCQERLICFMSSDPSMFSPISDLILRELKEEYGPIKKSEKSLLWKYSKALRTGIVSTLDQCENAYKKCPLTPKKILNTPFLKTWQLVTSVFGLHLV